MLKIHNIMSNPSFPHSPGEIRVQGSFYILSYCHDVTFNYRCHFALFIFILFILDRLTAATNYPSGTSKVPWIWIKSIWHLSSKQPTRMLNVGTKQPTARRSGRCLLGMDSKDSSAMSEEMFRLCRGQREALFMTSWQLLLYNPVSSAKPRYGVKRRSVQSGLMEMIV